MIGSIVPELPYMANGGYTLHTSQGTPFKWAPFISEISDLYIYHNNFLEDGTQMSCFIKTWSIIAVSKTPK